MTMSRANNVKESKDKHHAVFIPYPFQGHIIPSVQLAIMLASKGITITYINTEAIHNQTKRAHSHHGDDIFAEARESGLDIRYTTISDGLPLNYDRSLNMDQFNTALLHVFKAHLENKLDELGKCKEGPRITHLIADYYFVWTNEICQKYELFAVTVWTEAALVLNLYNNRFQLNNNGHFVGFENDGSHKRKSVSELRRDTIDYIPGVEAIEPKDMPSYLQEKDTSTLSHQIIKGSLAHIPRRITICNVVLDLEPDSVEALRREKNDEFKEHNVFAIGPIIQFRSNNKKSVATSLWPESDCTQWLDKKPKGSVLYVSFGSWAHISRKDIEEIAHGISLSNVSFVWVLRPDIVSSVEYDILPVDFREEVHDRSMIIPWCCQMTVLGHPAIGGFLTHCGWNSILESIWCKKPMLCYPLITDQFTNRKLVVDDWKVGINLSSQEPIRDRKTGTYKYPISKHSISERINKLIGPSGDEYRKAIQKLGMTLENALKPNGSQEKELDAFIKKLSTISLDQ